MVVKDGFEKLEFKVFADEGNIWTKRKQLKPENPSIIAVDPVIDDQCKGCNHTGEIPMINY